MNCAGCKREYPCSEGVDDPFVGTVQYRGDGTFVFVEGDRSSVRPGYGTTTHVSCETTKYHQCQACGQKKAVVHDLPQLPMCQQCAKAWRMGYRCGEDSLVQEDVVKSVTALREAVGLLSDLESVFSRVKAFLDRECDRR